MQENNEIKYLKLEDIIPNRLQPRTEFDEEKLNELANSIKQYGVINPLIVRPVGNKYEIIAGERRYKASGIAGLSEVPVIISNMDDSTSAEVAIIENIQRQDLSSLEEARSYRKLLDQGNITQEQLAHKMGKNQSTIANKMRLLNLCDEVQEALENNQISERHARSLLQLKSIDAQREMLEKIIAEKLNVKSTENVIKEYLQAKNLGSNNEILENNTIPTTTLNENIYGNDIVSIMDLNKKELEKENDNMNNNEQNIQINPGVMSASSNMETAVTPINPTAPAFGDRFFPSLEDQETNLNLNNPFESHAPLSTTAPVTPSMSQPLMENLVDPTPVAPTMPPVQPEVAVNIPSFVTNNQTAPVMQNPIVENQASTEINLPPMFDANPQTPEPIVEPMLQNDFVQNVPITPVTSPISMVEAIPNNNIVAEPIINPLPTTAPEVSTSMPMPEITPEPVLPPVQPEPVTAPVLEQQLNVPQTPEPMPTVEMPVELPTLDQTSAFSTVTAPTDSVVEPTVQDSSLVAQAPEYKTTENIINAINALKNLGLSISSIGYKATINEEDTANTYKITIELEK